MKCSDIFKYLQELYPLKLAMDWDNSGFLLGREDEEVKNILVVLDITKDVINYALENNVNLIVAHHPIIFSSIKQITDKTLLGNYILKLLENNISVIAMHTNFDIAKGGMGDIAEEKLGLKNTSPLEVTALDEEGRELGVGKIGDLLNEIPLNELTVSVKKVFNLKNLIVYGKDNIKDNIKTLAVSPGSGKGMYKYALGKAKVLITGDITHHEGLDAINEGMCIIDAGHYGLEHVFIDKISNDLKVFENINILKYKNTNPMDCIV